MPASSTLTTPPPPTRSIAARDAVVGLLLAAIAAERRAGDDRLHRFRDTRRLIGAAREAGFSVAVLADAVGVGRGTVHERSDPPGPMSVVRFLELLPEVDPARARAVLAPHGHDRRSTAELLRWLMDDADRT